MFPVCGEDHCKLNSQKKFITQRKRKADHEFKSSERLRKKLKIMDKKKKKNLVKREDR